MKIEIDVPGRDELEQQIVDATARLLLYSDDGYSGEVRNRIVENITDKCHQVVSSEIEKLVMQQLLTPIQPTNEVGEPVGDPITFRARIAKQVKEWFEEKVDRDGKPRRDGYDSFHRDYKPRVDWALVRAVDEVCGATLQQEISKAVSEMKAQIGGKVTAAASDAVRRLLQIS